MALCGSSGQENCCWETLLYACNNPTEETHAAAGKRKSPSKPSSAALKGEGEARFAEAKEVSVIRRDESDDEQRVHIWTERERRKKMRDMFSCLHVMLPHLPPKADKTTIVDATIDYIKTLEDHLQKAQNLKQKTLEREEPMPREVETTSGDSRCFNSFPSTFKTWTSPNLVLNISGDTSQICLCYHRKPGLFTSICQVLREHNIELVSAQVSADNNRTLCMIQLHARRTLEPSEMIPAAEEIFKQVAEKIMLLLSI